MNQFSQLNELDFSLFINLVEFLKQLLVLLFKDIDLLNIFCISIITRPMPNSTADSTKKKKVNDRKLTLSYRRPIDKDKT